MEQDPRFSGQPSTLTELSDPRGSLALTQLSLALSFDGKDIYHVKALYAIQAYWRALTHRRADFEG